jgi:LysR family glycine cleavage system transcriptional activator
MGQQLFLRQGNRILLTDAGRKIYPALETAFREIASVAPAASARQRPNRKRLILSVLPWLAPWAVSALQGHETAIEIRSEPDPVALTEGAADLRLTYGAALYPDHRVVSLFTDRMTLVQTSAKPIPTARVQIDWGAAYGSIPGWQDWHALNDLPPAEPTLDHKVNDPHLALSLLHHITAAALVPRLLADQNLQKANLQHTDTPLTLGWPYVLICLNARLRDRALMALSDHLAAQATHHTP